MPEADVVFFERDGRSFIPAPHARGPWNPDVMHGRLIAGLVARTMEREHGRPDFQFSRLTVDLFRPPPMAPIETETRLARDGNRIRVIDASVTSDGVEIARASAVTLRRAEQPSGVVWGPPEWSVPLPDDIDFPYVGAAGDAPPGSPPRRGFIPGMDMRPITRGGFGAAEQKRTWIRQTGQLLAGEELTPFVHVALAADFTNPLANSGDQGLQFINADITLYLHRLPVSEWVGFEVAGHRSDAGVAVGECTLYDTRGSIGHSIVCAVTNRRMAIPS